MWSLGCKQGGNVVLVVVLVTKGWNSFSFSLVLVDKPILILVLVYLQWALQESFSFVLV